MGYSLPKQTRNLDPPHKTGLDLRIVLEGKKIFKPKKCGDGKSERFIVFGIHQLELGPVVESIVSLTSQLVKCFATLYTNTLKFFVEKVREAFALHSHFFIKNYWHI